MIAKRDPHLFRPLLPQLRRTLDVSEQERHRPRGLSCHRHALTISQGPPPRTRPLSGDCVTARAVHLAWPWHHPGVVRKLSRKDHAVVGTTTFAQLDGRFERCPAAMALGWAFEPVSFDRGVSLNSIDRAPHCHGEQSYRSRS